MSAAHQGNHPIEHFLRSIAIWSSTSPFPLPLFIQLSTRFTELLTVELLSGIVLGHSKEYTSGYGSVEHTIHLGEGCRTLPHQYNPFSSKYTQILVPVPPLPPRHRHSTCPSAKTLRTGVYCTVPQHCTNLAAKKQ